MPLLVFIPIGVTVILTFALCVALKISLNMANILMVPLILGLGVDTGIHIVHRHTQGQGAGDTMDPAIRRAVMISGLTTIGTFLFAEFEPPSRCRLHWHLTFNCDQRVVGDQFAVNADTAPVVCDRSGRGLVHCQSTLSFV